MLGAFHVSCNMCRVPVDVTFTAHQEKQYSFQLKCKVKRKSTPLILKISAEGYSINLGITYTSPDGSETKFSIGKSDERVIDFGQVQVNDSALGKLSVFSYSLYSFEYCWISSCDTRFIDRDAITVEPRKGEVIAGSRVSSQLKFKPTKKMTLYNCLLTLEVGLKPQAQPQGGRSSRGGFDLCSINPLF